jgi:hypothetical protein
MDYFFSSVDFWGLVIPHCDVVTIRMVFLLNKTIYANRHKLYDINAKRIFEHSPVIGKLVVFGHAIKYADDTKTLTIEPNGRSYIGLYGDAIVKTDPPNVLLVANMNLGKSKHIKIYDELVFVPPPYYTMSIRNPSNKTMKVKIVWRFYNIEKHDEMSKISGDLWHPEMQKIWINKN